MRRAARVAAATALVASASGVWAQAFDVTHCYAGTATVVFASDDAVVASFDHKGIYRANGDSKLLHGASIHCAGITTVINKKRTVSGGCKTVDPKGDTIAGVFEGAGPAGGDAGTAQAVGGTGTWKGVSGGGNWQVHTPSKPLVPGTFQGCLRFHGAYKVPGK
ncbi:MAG TPA: hypothetical protein VLA41_10145 [Burkholderiales bacterium]|nr:hypothetical protein [Burkholderiales bacterium]